MKRPSASSAETFVRCPASSVLPQHESYGDASERGTDGHAILTALIEGRDGAEARLSERFPGLNPVSFLDADDLSAEVAYVVDLQRRASSFIGKDIGRRYETFLGRPMEPYEIGVSLDVHGHKDGKHWIRDFKFGRYSSWWQLYVQAMAVAWRPGQSAPWTIDAGFIHIEEPEEGEFRITHDSQVLYAEELVEKADELVIAFDSARTIEASLDEGAPVHELKTVEGKWCQYCGAYPHCPSKWKLVKALGHELDLGSSVNAMTLEQCGVTWKRLGEIEKNIIRKAKDVLRERLRHEGAFPLENGKVLKLYEMPGRPSLNREAVMSLLLAKGVTQAEIDALFTEGKPYERVQEVLRR